MHTKIDHTGVFVTFFIKEDFVARHISQGYSAYYSEIDGLYVDFHEKLQTHFMQIA